MQACAYFYEVCRETCTLEEPVMCLYQYICLYICYFIWFLCFHLFDALDSLNKL